MTLVETHRPTAGEAWLRYLKVAGFSARRLAEWTLHPQAWPAPLRHAETSFPQLVYERSIPVRREDPDADSRMEEGKCFNLALAAPHFDGLVLAPDRPLSFWKALGRVTARAGYRPGMELRGGCIVPTLGGGLCLLSNALFEMAARLGWDVLERHGHTAEAVPPDPEALWGLDATVFWPYVDLRVAPQEGPVRLEVRVADGSLTLRAFAAQPSRYAIVLNSEDELVEATPQGRFRCNSICRTILDRGTGQPLEVSVIAVNRKRILASAQRRRNCYTCGEATCPLRPAWLKEA